MRGRYGGFTKSSTKNRVMLAGKKGRTLMGAASLTGRESNRAATVSRARQDQDGRKGLKMYFAGMGMKTPTGRQGNADVRQHIRGRRR
jgi:hypothetical protein